MLILRPASPAIRSLRSVNDLIDCIVPYNGRNEWPVMRFSWNETAVKSPKLPATLNIVRVDFYCLNEKATYYAGIQEPSSPGGGGEGEQQLTNRGNARVPFGSHQETIMTNLDGVRVINWGPA